MSARRLGVGILLVLAAAYFLLFVQDPLPARTDVAIDWARVRALAGEPSTGPRSIGSEVVARGRFFGWMICAGCGWGEVPMEFRTHQLRWADGRSVVIDAVHGADLHAAMPLMADYDEAAFARQTEAIRSAAATVLTHEHWDHANGLRAVVDDPGVRARIQLPAAQRESAAIREAGFSEAELASLPAIPDADYRAIAAGVVAIAMPGHTPGSQVLYVRRADGVEYLFLGDIVWNARNLRERRGKSRLISAVAGEDAGAVLSQIAYFADVSAGASAGFPDFHLVVAHDPENNRALLDEGWIEQGLVLPPRAAAVPDRSVLAPEVGRRSPAGSTGGASGLEESARPRGTG
jgi:glyoxylase-like metal-dependent hydrolase (beta-lactamase superfamily II)